MNAPRPVLTVENVADSDIYPFVDRIAEKVRTLAAVKSGLVRLLEWHINSVLALSQCRLVDEREHGCGSHGDETQTDQNHAGRVS